MCSSSSFLIPSFLPFLPIISFPITESFPFFPSDSFLVFFSSYHTAKDISFFLDHSWCFVHQWLLIPINPHIPFLSFLYLIIYFISNLDSFANIGSMSYCHYHLYCPLMTNIFFFLHLWKWEINVILRKKLFKLFTVWIFSS